jgi:hypothetical protein
MTRRESILQLGTILMSAATARALIVEVNGGMLATEGAEYEPVPGELALARRESLETVVAAVDTLVKRMAA